VTVSEVGPAPLAGRRIAVTRAGGATHGLTARLRALGAEPIACPTIAIVPPADWRALDAALARLDTYDWLVFASANAVRAFGERREALGLAGAPPATLRIAAVGRATAAMARAVLRAPDLVPADGRAAGLVAALGAMAGRCCLIPSSDIARPELADGLRAAGATVEVVTAYRTLPVAPGALGTVATAIRNGMLDAVTFTSPSTVAGFLDGLAGNGLAPGQLARLPHRPALCCIGPTTATAIRDYGLSVDAIADEPNDAGLVTALVRCLAGRPPADHEGERIVC